MMVSVSRSATPPRGGMDSGVQHTCRFNLSSLALLCNDVDVQLRPPCQPRRQTERHCLHAASWRVHVIGKSAEEGDSHDRIAFLLGVGWRRITRDSGVTIGSSTDWEHVPYEELCRDTECTCERLCEFLGYSYDSRMVEPSRETKHTIGGNKIRLSVIGSVREDLSWREHLSRDDVRLIDSLTLELARKLRYGPANDGATWASELTI